MKTKEFIKRVEELGFEYEKAEEVYFIYDYEGTEYAAVCHTTPNQISNTERAWDWLDKDVQEELFDLIVEYARTPIEDREEEKKFYLEHKNQRSVDGSALYFTIYISHNFLLVKSQVISENLKQKFTLKEIKEIKEKYDIDLADFELVEVENEG